MYEYISFDNIRIFVGETAKENEELTKSSRPDDWWLHVVDRPGAHVIIQYNKDSVPKETVNDAAAIAVYHSRAKILPKVCVHIVRAMNVIPGKQTGQVNVIEIASEKNIFMNKEHLRMQRLLKTRIHNKTWNTNSGNPSCFGRKTCTCP
jgi:predicted ribosome quality control (RQC) complex YloA/Tae2 family protein